MSRYIDALEVNEMLGKAYNECAESALMPENKAQGLIAIGINYARNLIMDKVPAVDVKPIVRGEWKIESVAMSDELPVMFEQYVARCSVCGRKEYIGILSNEKEGIKKAQEKYPYCNCGADMRSNNAERISETE